MSKEDRDLLIEAVTTLKYVERDIKELKDGLKNERAETSRLKLKIYKVSGLINGITVAINFVLHFWAVAKPSL